MVEYFEHTKPSLLQEPRAASCEATFSGCSNIKIAAQTVRKTVQLLPVLKSLSKTRNGCSVQQGECLIVHLVGLRFMASLATKRRGHGGNGNHLVQRPQVCESCRYSWRTPAKLKKETRSPSSYICFTVRFVLFLFHSAEGASFMPETIKSESPTSLTPTKHAYVCRKCLLLFEQHTLL